MQKARQIEITYSVTVPELTVPARRVDVWIPFPRSTTDQDVQSIDVRASMPYELAYDSEYGNAVLHAVAEGGRSLPYELVVTAQAIRYERSVRLRQGDDKDPIQAPPFARQLAETGLIRFSPEILSIAAGLKNTHHGTVEIARAAYDCVLERMSYDKTGEGWGTGSSEWACSIGKGNCTDFHSLFLAIMRACGIPAEFEMGVAFPTGMTAGDITAYKCGYHCWTSFYAPGQGWVPVDCSEAALKPGLRDYYFGAIDENRFLLSYGRDLMLPGRPGRQPVNFFTEPVVETETGTPLPYTKVLTFKDVGPWA